MKLMLGSFLIIAITFQSGCSQPENVKCRGVFSQELNNVTETKNNAALGFNIERASLLGRIISSRKGWKGFVLVSYDSDPYARHGHAGGGVLYIKDDDGMMLNADSAIGKSGELLIYSPISGTVMYDSSQRDSTQSFSGVCRQASEP